MSVERSSLNRRTFLKLLGTAGAAVLLKAVDPTPAQAIDNPNSSKVDFETALNAQPNQTVEVLGKQYSVDVLVSPDTQAAPSEFTLERGQLLLVDMNVAGEDLTANGGLTITNGQESQKLALCTDSISLGGETLMSFFPLNRGNNRFELGLSLNEGLAVVLPTGKLSQPDSRTFAQDQRLNLGVFAEPGSVTTISRAVALTPVS